MTTDSTPPADDPLTIERDPYAALRERDFRLFLSGNFLWVLGFKMQSVAVGYEIFRRTEWPLALGSDWPGADPARAGLGFDRRSCGRSL